MLCGEWVEFKVFCHSEPFVERRRIQRLCLVNSKWNLFKIQTLCLNFKRILKAKTKFQIRSTRLSSSGSPKSKILTARAQSVSLHFTLCFCWILACRHFQGLRLEFKRTSCVVDILFHSINDKIHKSTKTKAKIQALAWIFR